MGVFAILSEGEGCTFVFALSTNVETPIAVVINPVDRWPR